ncbi:MAG: hypothetical protein K2N20_06260 [Helicobacter sp.]|nr:hypothetical protein [Helicobacter sp.]
MQNQNMESIEMFRYAQHDKIPMSLRASGASVAINKQRIPSERSKTFDCFGQRPRNDTWNLAGFQDGWYTIRKLCIQFHISWAKEQS